MSFFIFFFSFSLAINCKDESIPLGALPLRPYISKWYKLPFMKVFCGEGKAQLFEAVFPFLPHAPTYPFHVA